ncbi:unnamed protein product, partial [Notodromas monacha]
MEEATESEKTLHRNSAVILSFYSIMFDVPTLSSPSFGQGRNENRFQFEDYIPPFQSMSQAANNDNQFPGTDIFSSAMEMSNDEKMMAAMEIMSSIQVHRVDQKEYMMRYGYVSPNETMVSLMTDADTTMKGLNSLLDMANITDTEGKIRGILKPDPFRVNFTGKANNALMDFIRGRRCGMRDFPGVDEVPATSTETRRKKRYALQGSRWRRPNLTYRINQYSRGKNGVQLPAQEIDRIMAAAFQTWENVTNLRFTRASRGMSVDIDIDFAKQEHGDGSPFDGRGQVIAHAYYPSYGGDSHFDDEELWTSNENAGTNLLQVAVHEFGHALGLEHSNVMSAIMFPRYQGYIPNFKLDPDDVIGIQVRDLVWSLGERGVENGYPMLANELWPRVPSNMDAAVYIPFGDFVLFFKNDQYWRYNLINGRFVISAGFPRNINSFFRGIPANLDAVFMRRRSGTLYFFKDANYWTFSLTRGRTSAPMSIARPFRGGPTSKIAAIITWRNGVTYVFQGDQYWRYNDMQGRIVTEANGMRYPASTSQHWFGCNSNTASKPNLRMADEARNGVEMEFKNEPVAAEIG